MNIFQVDDIVRVKTQPKMQPWMRLNGIIARIVEIQGDFCMIQEISPFSGCGVVEIACLEKLESDHEAPSYQQT